MKFIHNIRLFFVTYFYRFLTFILPIFIRKKNAQDGILFLENFPIESSGYQYRAGKWKNMFEQNNFRCEVVTIKEDKNEFELLFNNSLQFNLKSMHKKFRHCLYARRFKTVIVRRELLLYNDYGNLFMDKFLLKIHNNVILDFDDDIAAAKQQPRKIKSFYGKILQENGNKFNDSLRLYKRFIVGSKYLKERVLQENKTISEHNILIIPTCVDYDKYPAKTYNFDKEHIFTFGWIGGNQNYHLLQGIIPVLNNLSKDHKFKLLVIGGKKFETQANFEIDFRKWGLNTEIKDLMDIDIGLMPLINNDVSKGKCGFKLIQYMGLGIVAIATNITVNGDIIKNEENSYLVNNENSNWYDVLEKVMNNKENFIILGKMARKTIFERYSFSANINKYIDFLCA